MIISVAEIIQLSPFSLTPRKQYPPLAVAPCVAATHARTFPRQADNIWSRFRLILASLDRLGYLSKLDGA